MLIILIVKFFFKIPILLMNIGYNIPVSAFKALENYDIRSKKFSYSLSDLLHESKILPITPKSFRSLLLLIVSYLISSTILTALVLLAILHKALSPLSRITRITKIEFSTSSKLYQKIKSISGAITINSILTLQQFSENTIITILFFNSPPIIIRNTILTQKSIIEWLDFGQKISSLPIKYILTTIWLEL